MKYKKLNKKNKIREGKPLDVFYKKWFKDLCRDLDKAYKIEL